MSISDLIFVVASAFGLAAAGAAYLFGLSIRRQYSRASIAAAAREERDRFKQRRGVIAALGTDGSITAVVRGTTENEGRDLHLPAAPALAQWNAEQERAS